MKTNWTTIIPIYNLELTKDVNNELQIGRVLFVSTDKIPRIRKRLGFTKPFSYYKNLFTKKNSSSLLSKVKTCAIIKSKREKNDKLNSEFKLIKEAVYILASSQFYKNNRYNKILFGSPHYGIHLVDEYLLVDNKNDSACWNNRSLTNFRTFKIDKNWKQYISYHFFNNLLKIINGKKKVNDNWKDDIKKSSILAGQSYFAHNIWEAFLYNIIAIELLLVNRNEKKSPVIIDRLIALFGWFSNISSEDWEESITRLYGLRSDFVHNGDTDKIKPIDLIESDLILYNLLSNICSLTNKIKCKKDIIELSSKIKARSILNLKIIERPKKLYFSKKNISSYSLKRLEEMKHWY